MKESKRKKIKKIQIKSGMVSELTSVAINEVNEIFKKINIVM